MSNVRPMFLADWPEALFVHFRVDPASLSRIVPFPLDTRDGDAFVSLVAFTQRNLRPAIGGRFAAWMSAPLAQHEFLNLRAYVQVNGQPAIYFIAEWIPNRLAILLGPRLYGLPYRLGALRYYHANTQQMHGSVVASIGRFEYRAQLDPSSPFDRAIGGSLDHFLLERYTAYTFRRGIARRFDVAHAPWPQRRAEIELIDTSLLRSVLPATESAQLIGANFSPGVCDVSISSPQKNAETRLIRG